MQKTRPRRTGKQTAPERGASSESPGSGRSAHVRNRLIVAVAVVAAAIAGAGAPSVVAASGQLNDSQSLVTLAEQTQDALTLAHSLADERDAVTSYVAAGRPKSQAPEEQQSARVDREIEDLRADPDVPAALRKDLDDVGSVRRAALVGKTSALEVHRAYSAAITELHALADQLAEKIPPRAGSGAYALAQLDSAVQQAAAARGLLLAALSVPHTTQTVINPVTGLPTTTTGSSSADTEQRDALTAAAQQAAVRSDAAVADFHDTATKTARASYDSTVTGPEVTSAEKYLAALTDQPTLSDSDLGLSTKKVDAALSARVDQMRGVESSLYESRSKDLAQLRDSDVTALEIRIAVLGALMLVAVGTAMGMARSLTRPLAVLRLGSARVAADPAGEEPVKFTGRNDEFAQVVRSVNTLHAHAVGLQERLGTLEADRKHLVGQRQAMADERARLRAELDEAAAHLEQVRHSIHSTFVNLALRTLGLVERQLTVIEGLEEREQDPERLSTLFRLDHFATVMRRHSENLLVLAGAEHVQQHAGPVPLVDVVRAAVSEIERYERVRIAALPPHAHIAGFVADDLSHLVAELLENATSFSPPDVAVEISGWLLESGEVMLSIQDEGIGMTGERMSRLNARLAEFDPAEPYDQEGGEGLGLGLYVVARLAHRHGVRVQLREQKQGGIAAVVVLPKTLFAAAPAAAVPPAAAGTVAGGTAPVSLPGADAEANSNVLSGRTRITVREPQGDEDPLIAAAEQAVHDRNALDARNARDADTPQATAWGEGTARDEEVVRDAGAVREDAPARGGFAAPDGFAAYAGFDAPDGFGPSDGFAAHGDEPARESADTAGKSSGPAPAPEPPADPSGPETTMELLLPSPRAEQPPSAPDAGPRPAGGPYTIGPDTHERTVDQGEPAAAQALEESEAPRLTAKGLPKRTPKISAPAPAPRQRAGGVDAEALRRRLGGFHRGAAEGYRHAEAEIAEQTGEHRAPAHRPATPPQNATPGTTQDVEPSGGTVEEASS
ncbi:nitrate- and nitrite sensing domain-containing protein [Streptomyces sp. NPDC047079]|uniref:sensor histidine kinase n=1 Tax=Streptomyces sp. NPDC047079 TaxID=3154607 RepID=UPI00340150AB